MVFFAISDLHLSNFRPKPMDIFGEKWANHAQRIAENWDSTVGPDDIVLVAGDTSWALRFPEAVPDLDYLAERPGRKILIRGNHDYWWARQGTNKIQREIDPSITLIQGTSVTINGVGIVGTRGWRLEDYNAENPSEDDAKIYNRELAHLRRSVASLPDDVHTRIAMLHYPPFDLGLQPNEFRKVLDESGTDILVYGHIHNSTGSYLEGDVDGITYHLAAVDHIDFTPIPILSLD